MRSTFYIIIKHNITSPITHLAEVSHSVTSVAVGQCHHVEQERFHIVVQRFVIEEKFGQQTQVLAVLFVPFAIHLPHAELTLAVNLRKEQNELVLIWRNY